MVLREAAAAALQEGKSHIDLDLLKDVIVQCPDSHT